MNKVINPNENLLIPKWITAEYFEKVLKHDGKVYESISNFIAVAATAAGENFTSIMLRIHLNLDLMDGTKKHKTYIMKTMMDDTNGVGSSAEIKRMQLFPKELQMYAKYLPAFEELYKAAGKTVKLSPRCLLIESQENRINFVFEDLSVKGFANVERTRGFNMDGIRRSLQKLAELHAASVVYFEQNGPYSDVYQFSFVHESSYEAQKHMFSTKLEQFKEAMKTWEIDDVDKYLDKFVSFGMYAC